MTFDWYYHSFMKKIKNSGWLAYLYLAMVWHDKDQTKAIVGPALWLGILLDVIYTVVCYDYTTKEEQSAIVKCNK